MFRDERVAFLLAQPGRSPLIFLGALCTEHSAELEFFPDGFSASTPPCPSVGCLSPPVLSISNSDLSGLPQPCVSTGGSRRQSGQRQEGGWAASYRMVAADAGELRPTPSHQGSLVSWPTPHGSSRWRLLSVGVVGAPKCTCPAGPCKWRPGMEGELRAVESPTSR